MTLVVVPCGVCGGTAFRDMYPTTIPVDEIDPAPYFGSSRLRAGHLPIVRCLRCGLLMANPQDDPVTLAETYRTSEDKVYELEYANRHHSALKHLALVSAYHPKPMRLLDVGCGSGIFVCAAHNAGWQASGLDASEWMVAQGQIRCPTARFFRIRSLADATFPAGTFEVITLWDVLEHVPSPLETLQRLRGWLTPRGWLFLSVPNAASMMARLMGSHWMLLLREHLWYFSPNTMSMLLSQAGFELIDTRRKLVQFSLANILNRLGQYPGTLASMSGRGSRVRAFGCVRLRFPIGEMDVVGRAK